MTAAAGQPKLIVEADAESLARAAAERVMARIAANPGRIAICLTGGSSPKRLYQLLGSDAEQVQVAFVTLDPERCCHVHGDVENRRLSKPGWDVDGVWPSPPLHHLIDEPLLPGEWV